MARPLTYISIIFLFGIFQSQAQPLAIDRYYEGEHGLTPILDIRLFDLKEIAARRIDTAYIIRHPSSWEPGFPNACSFGDTLFLYCFDSKGRIIQYTYFQGMGDYSTTFHYDSLGKILSREMYRRKGKDAGTKIYPTVPNDTTKWKSIVKTDQLGTDTVFTEIVFWRFKNGTDTSYIISKVKDRYGRIIELSSRVNKQYEREINDDTGELTYHYKYCYDTEGRLIYLLSYDYKDRPSISQTITYPDYGQIIESRDATTNRLLDTEVRLKSVANGVITITNQTSQITLSPFEKGSKLYKLKTVSSSGEYPYIEYYEISYL
jgi:hypothetical protein